MHVSLFHWCDWLTLTLTDWLKEYLAGCSPALQRSCVWQSHCDTLWHTVWFKQIRNLHQPTIIAICLALTKQLAALWQSWILFIYASLSGHWGGSSFRWFLITVDYFSHKSAIVRLTVLDFQSRAQKFHPSWKNQSGLKFSLKYCSWRVGASLENPPLQFWVGSASTIYHDHPPLPNMEKM